MPNIGTTALAAFTAIKSACADTVVSVTINGVTQDAVRNTQRGDGGLIGEGYIGQVTRAIWTPASTVGTVRQGQRITVAGASCEVASANPDPAGALIRIDYVERDAPTGRVGA